MKKRAIGVAALLVVAACGGAAQGPPAASSPAAPPAAQDEAAPSRGAAPVAPSTPDEQPVPDGARRSTSGPESDRLRARSDFDDAARQLDASMNECAAACRALASMERATAHLCEIARANDADAPSCDDARKKLHAARERVRRACNSCPAGPTLDPGAPP